ncbi:MAG: hypothetical protein SGI73_22885 [Chloroflexota bacterium]|nr:hypothetical protein [Chloroflexota bacterium]
MGKLWDKNGIKSVLLALIFLGVALTAFAIYGYIRNSYEIGQNVAYQIQSQNRAIDPQTQTEGQMLMVADIQLRELVRDRNVMMIIGGVGLVLLAVGWIGRDWLSGQTSKIVT